MNIINKFANGLKKTSNFLNNSIVNTIKSNKIDDNTLEEIESALISADIGLEVTNFLINKIKKSNIKNNVNANTILKILAEEIDKILANCEKKLIYESNKKSIFIFAGVNGSGKTTTIGKLVNKIDNKKKILIAACDTFRAGAVDQLKKWTNKENIDFFQGELNQDPASVAFLASEKFKNENFDYLIIDTAGRLSNNTNLINQLIKISSVIKKSFEEEIINNLLVLDGTNGSNMIQQVEKYKNAIGVSGIIITKLDGTAKGGAIIQIAKKYQTPIHFIGIGEGENDLLEFESKRFSYSLLGLQ